MIIYNKYIPFDGFIAMAIFPFIFVRGTEITDKTLNHERIHFAQQKELLIVFFYIIYLSEYLINLAKGKSRYEAYKSISFEREAYANDRNSDYLKERKFYSWLKYL